MPALPNPTKAVRLRTACGPILIVSRKIARGGAILGLIVLGSATASWGNGICSFPPQPPVILKNMGPCEFDPVSLSFSGAPDRQAACLLNPVLKIGKLGPPLDKLPAVFANRVGRSVNLPDREAVRALLRERGLDADFGPALSRRVARAQDDDPLSRPATYFVIHDTSSPNFRRGSWPQNIDHDLKINNLARYSCDNKIERAHVFINRMGAILHTHGFEIPWRATKFEMAVQFGTMLKGLFLHAELVQPRRPEPRRGRRNDFQAPVPGFTPAQYDALALVYVIASVRAGFWLIPAFHAVIDEGIHDKHDDPQNFELEAFAASLDRLQEHLWPLP